MPIIKSTSEVDGQPVDIYIEVDKVPDAYYKDTLGNRQIQAVGDVFGDGLALSRQCAGQVFRSVNQLSDAVKPNEFEVQLAIKLSAEGGVPTLTKFGAEAQMQVTMKWTLKKT